MKKKKGFTLIELIAVLVIMTIITLIVTPLVMNIIRKARIAADKRSIDAYGRSIELAIASYLLDNGKFPTDISQLTIEYSGDEVVCSITQLNGDSSVYLAECTVGGRTVNYSYGTDNSPSYPAYNVGEEVTYNGVSYYVIKDSGVKEQAVTLLKAEPLSYEEIEIYSNGTVAKLGSHMDYAVMQYHATSNAYLTSYIKTTVDAWKTAKAPESTEARLITSDEYSSLTVAETYETPTEPGIRYVPQYDWMYNHHYCYWTMSPYIDCVSDVLSVGIEGTVGNRNIAGDFNPRNGQIESHTICAVRPVIVLDKSVLTSS